VFLNFSELIFLCILFTHILVLFLLLLLDTLALAQRALQGFF
jgi:hypothetical protein